MRVRVSRTVTIGILTIMAAIAVDMSGQLLWRVHVKPMAVAEFDRWLPWTVTLKAKVRTPGEHLTSAPLGTPKRDGAPEPALWRAPLYLFVLVETVLYGLKMTALLLILYWLWGNLPGRNWWQKGLVGAFLVILIQGGKSFINALGLLLLAGMFRWPLMLNVVCLTVIGLGTLLVLAFGVDRMHRSRMKMQPALAQPTPT